MSSTTKNLKTLTTLHSGVIREKQSDDLFAIDVKGDLKISKKYPKHAVKTLKADEILAQRSAIPGVGTHKRAADAKTTDGVQPSAKRHKGAYVSEKEYERLRKIAYGGDTVKKDQPLLVIESMKMETVIRSPGEGLVVKRVVHGQGKVVGSGVELVEFEEQKEGGI